MRIGTRVRKLAEARRPECRPVELRVEGASEPVTERDRCPGCGGYHVIVVRERIVESLPTIVDTSRGASGRTDEPRARARPRAAP